MACRVARPSHAAVEERGNLVLDNIPSVDTPLTAKLDDYMNSRGASFVDWLPDGGVLIATRFGDVEQLHRVAMPLGAREQLTFYREPVTSARSPQSAVAPGFVFLKDQGGNEYAQVYWYDTATRAVRMLTDGKGLNGGLAWSHDGRRVAFHGTGRDGVSYDLFIAEPANNFAAPRLVFNGFQKNWSVQDWSPDDTKLLINNFVSANESHLFVMDIATAALTPVSEGDGRRERLAGEVHARRPRRLPGHQPRQRVPAAAARRPGHRRGRDAHRRTFPGTSTPSRAATTAATSPGWPTSTARAASRW